MSSLIEKLQAAKKSLTHETWHQGSYFSNKNNTLCMCAHGALQVQVNPACSEAVDYTRLYTGINRTEVSPVVAEREAYSDVVKVARSSAMKTGGALAAIVGNNDANRILVYTNTLTGLVRAVAEDALTAARTTANATDTTNNTNPISNFDILRSVWNQRSASIKHDHVFNNINYGNTDAHYLLGMAGLTASFNDAGSTTLEMVHQKFDEAIELARQLSL